MTISKSPESGSTLLEFRRGARTQGWPRPMALRDPVAVIEARTLEEVRPALREIDAQRAQGRIVAGWLAYEAGFAFCPHPPEVDAEFPLIWMGVFEAEQARTTRPFGYMQEWPNAAKLIGPGIDEARFVERIGQIKEAIAAGETYQVNYTERLRLHVLGKPRWWWRQRLYLHPVGYAAFVRAPDFEVASLSPELFLEGRIEGEDLVLRSRPMKGTARREVDARLDRAVARRLRTDAKTRAENVMILDLMRNDLGRLAAPGGVRVTQRFCPERYRSVWQLTSEVEARMPRATSIERMMEATFPPGSVTGAPKWRTMEWIERLETQRRRVYCGSVGMFLPDGSFCLNVAIRTLWHGREEPIWTLGVGAGIVADSDARAELRETELKAAFALAKHETGLIETLRWEPDTGPMHLKEHLARMRRSARQLGIRFSRQKALQEIEHVVSREKPERPLRLRLELSDRGQLGLQLAALPAHPVNGWQLMIARCRREMLLDPGHKSTRRTVYNEALAAAQTAGCDEALLVDERGMLLEGARTAVMVRIDGEWQTPTLRLGIVPSTWRARWMREARTRPAEIRLEDLARAERIVVGNSVRGAIEVQAIADERGRIKWQHKPDLPAADPIG